MVNSDMGARSRPHVTVHYFTGIIQKKLKTKCIQERRGGIMKCVRKGQLNCLFLHRNRLRFGQ